MLLSLLGGRAAVQARCTWLSPGGGSLQGRRQLPCEGEARGGGGGFENTLRRKRLRSRLHRKRAPREGRRGDGEQAPFPLNRGFSATFSVAVSAVSAGGGVTPPSFLRNLPRSFCEVAFSLPLPLPGAPPPLSHPACWSWAG